MEAATAHDSISLDAPLSSGGDDDGGGDYASTVGEPDRRFELIEERTAFEPTLRALPEREQTILKLRFEEDKTQAEIAEIIGVSQMHVSRLLRRALMRLRAVTESETAAPSTDDAHASSLTAPEKRAA